MKRKKLYMQCSEWWAKVLQKKPTLRLLLHKLLSCLQPVFRFRVSLPRKTSVKFNFALHCDYFTMFQKGSKDLIPNGYIKNKQKQNNHVPQRINWSWIVFDLSFWHFHFEYIQTVQGALSGLRQFLPIESPSEWWKTLFISPQNLFSFSRYLNFCLDFLVM